MGRVAGKSSKVYVNEHDLSGKTNSVELSFDVNLPEVTAMADGAATFVEGLPNNKVTQNSFFDADDGDIDENVWDEIAAAAAALLGVYPGQDASYADIGYELQAKPSSQGRPLEIAGAVLLNVSWQGSGPVVRSTVLCNGAVTATGVVANSTQNVGVSSSGDTYVGILRVLSVSGSGSITVKVQEDDAEGGAYSDLFTFTAATAVTSERETTTSATKAWKRVNVTAYATFTSVTIMVVIGKEK